MGMDVLVHMGIEHHNGYHREGIIAQRGIHILAPYYLGAKGGVVLGVPVRHRG